MHCTLPILAFGFTNPLLLSGLVLGSIPIVIHLLHKRRFRETSWAAMRFLLAAARKNSRRIRIEQLILLMVRVLILVLVALAMAQPFLESSGKVTGGDAPVHRIIVIDTSFSMDFRPAQRSRFEHAAEVARKIVKHGNSGDAYNLVQISQLPPHAIIKRPTYRSNQVYYELDQLEITHQTGEVLTALKEVKEIRDLESEIKRTEIYLISDFQRESWSPSGSGSGIRQLLQELADDSNTKLALIDLGQPQTPNLAVTGFRTEVPFITLDQPIPITATVRNFSDVPVKKQLLEFYVDGRKSDEKRIDLDPYADATVTFTQTFYSDGTELESQEHRLEVRLEDDSLPLDNRRWLSLPTKRQLKVLLVNGQQQGRPVEWATHYVSHALAPGSPQRPWDGLIQPRVIAERELRGTALDKYDCLFLCDVATISAQDAKLLTSYVESGGALVLCLGDQVDLESYNNALFQDGRGVLPVELTGYDGNALNPDPETDLFTFDTADLDHPIVQVFQGNPGTGLESAFTFQYVTVKFPPDSTAKTALRFSSNAPAIIEAPVKRGRVILVTTTVDSHWSTWARENPSYTPILQEMVKFAVSGGWRDRLLQIGEPVSRGIPAENYERSAQILRPDQQEEQIKATDQGTTGEFLYEGTTKAGLYQLKLGAPVNRTELYAVNLDPRESDLDKLTTEELETDLLPNINYRYRTDYEKAVFEGDDSDTARNLLSRWLLIAAFALLLVEQLMAWKFVPGFIALLILVVAAFFGQLLSPLWFGVTMTFLLAAGGWIGYKKRGLLTS